jgi:hypothetical protein
MAFALLSRSRSKPPDSVRPRHLRKSARVLRPADSRSGFAKPAFQPSFTALTTAPEIQAKLKIGEPNDKYEQEADRVAEQVMRMPEPEPGNQPARTTPSIGQRIQRLCPECEEELHRQPIDEDDEDKEMSLQAKGNTERVAPEVTPGLESRIQSLEGGGQPFPESVRAFFEPRLGYDFSQVRVHTDGGAAKAARTLNAHAFTFGRNIVFGPGEYAPETAAGKKLVAHELSHVVQQKKSGSLSIQLARLRDFRQRDIQPSVSELENTNEFKAYMNPRLIWQWQLRVTREEALLALLMMFEAMRRGDRIIWSDRAREFIMRARAALTTGTAFRRIVEQTFVEPAVQAVERLLAPPVPGPEGRESVPEQAMKLLPQEEVICGKLSEGSIVIKGSGRLPEKFRLLGEEWELRFVQQGQCCRTYIVRLKRTVQEERRVLKWFRFDGKIRSDGRFTRNICTGESVAAGRISWEGKLRLWGIQALERKLKEQGWSAGGAELVFKPQIGADIESPKKQGKHFRLVFFVKLRTGFEVSVGNRVIIEVRHHFFECDLGWLEIGGQIRGVTLRNPTIEFDLKVDECLSRLSSEAINAIPRAVIKIPGIEPPWHQRSNDFGRMRF